MPWIIKVFRIFFTKISIMPRKILSYWYLKSHGVESKYGEVTLLGFPIINRAPNSRIIIGKGVTIVSKSKYNFAGINHPTILATLAENAVIFIGEYSGISGSSICAVQKITIGSGCGLGVNTNIYDTDFHPLDPNMRKAQKTIFDAKSSPVSIGKDVWLSANVTVLKGVTIGDCSVISIGSVVTKDVHEKELHGGIPAVKIKNI